MGTQIDLFVAGRWRQASSGRTLALIDPASEAEIGRVPVATEADIAEAVAIAQEAFGRWRQTPAFERAAIIARAADLMRARADAIGRVATREQGKIFAEARTECLFAADVLQWAGEEARRLYGRIVPPPQPEGAHRRHASSHRARGGFHAVEFPAYDAGAQDRRRAGGRMRLHPESLGGDAGQRARHRAGLPGCGLPDGVLSVVFGDPAAISTQLTPAEPVRMISFTGSVPVGRTLGSLAAQNLKRAALELGGYAPVPVLVFDDVDVEATAAMAVQAKFRNAGQICIAPRRFYVHERIHDAFVDAMAKAAGALTVGDGLHEGVATGPLANLRRIEAVERMVADAEGLGARVMAGGHRIGNSGFFYEATVLAEVPDTPLAMRNEPFGPLALVQPFSRFDEAIENLPQPGMSVAPTWIARP